VAKAKLILLAPYRRLATRRDACPGRTMATETASDAVLARSQAFDFPVIAQKVK
jgi:hypothetical protein